MKKKKIKVIEVSSDSNIGGAGKCILTLIENFNRDEFDVSVLLPTDSKLKPCVEALGIRVIEVTGIAEQSLSKASIKVLKAIFTTEKPDIVHTHGCMSARIAAKACGAKVVYTRHSVFEPSPKISKGFGKLINGIVNNHYADSIIAVAEAAKDNLTATGVSAKKIDVILNGVDGLTPASKGEKQQIRNRFGVKDGERVISIVARLEDIKGHEYFIDAAEELLKTMPELKFFIAGTGSYKSRLVQRVKDKHLGKRVVFTGFITDVDKLLQITDVQVNASYGTEATSLALLEGMSIGVPAVVSDFGGNPGVITDGVNGFIFPQKDAFALAGELRRILTDDEMYREMCENSKQIFKKKFTSKRMTRDTEDIYRRLV